MSSIATTLTLNDRRFLQNFLPDEEGAPEIGSSLFNDLPNTGKWKTITDWHRLAITGALLPLTWFAQVHHPEWYIASDLAVYYQLPDGGRSYVGPDILVTRAPNHPRTSLDSVTEGGFPPFVLEVISTDSVDRDTNSRTGKVHLYDLLGVQEYAIFDPEWRIDPPLQGYRRTAQGGWEVWPAGPRGELYSAVLGLTLVVEGTLLRWEDAQGARLLTADEERARADALEARVAALQAQLDRLQGGQP